MKFLVNERQFKKVISRIHEQMEQYLLNEGVNEDRALEILKKNISVESEVEVIFNFLKGIDKSKNNKMLPAIASYYVNATSNDEYGQIVKTFQKLFNLTNEKGKPIPPPEVSLVSDDEVKILDHTFKTSEFEKFKNFVEHFYYVEDTNSDEVEREKLFDIDANQVFENEKFTIFEAPSDRVCIKLFGKDYEGRKFVKRSFCIGWGETPETGKGYYVRHRTSTGEWGITFYIVLDKEKYAKYEETNREEPSLMNAVGVRRADAEDQHAQKAPYIWNNELGFFVWDEHNPGLGHPVAAFGSGKESVGKYIKFLEDNGVNIRNVFKPKEFIDYSDEAVDNALSYQGDERSDRAFSTLTAKQKVKFISDTRTLTPLQVEFYMTKMPIKYIKAFLNNIGNLGEFKKEAFDKLGSNAQKTFVRTKLFQLFNGSENFNKNKFFYYLINDELLNFAISLIKESLVSEKNPNRNKEATLDVLGLLSPEDFVKSLSNQTNIVISNENYKLGKFPENIGEYLGSAIKITFKDLPHIKSIPESIGKATNLTDMFILNCDSLESIPNSIGELTNLTSLDIIGNKNLKSIPDSIGNLTNLEHLDLTNNGLTTIPKSVGNLKGLFILGLLENPIESLPVDEINGLEDLVHLGITIDGDDIGLLRDPDSGKYEKLEQFRKS